MIRADKKGISACPKGSLRALLLLCLLASAPIVAGEAPTPQNPPNDAVKLSREWKRLTTAHFEMVSNASEGDMKKIMAQLEAFRSSLIDRVMHLSTPAPIPTLVVLLKNAVAFESFQPRDRDGRKKENVGAYLQGGDDMNHIVMPCGEKTSESLRMIFHEYFHYVAHRVFPDVPPWLDEGLAEFFSTFDFDAKKGKGLIGRIIPAWLQLLRMDALVPLKITWTPNIVPANSGCPRLPPLSHVS